MFHQGLLHQVPWPPLVGACLAWGLSRGDPPWVVSLQLILPLVGHLCLICLFCPGLLEHLSPGLTNIVQHEHCNNDHGDGFLGDLQEGGEGLQTAFEPAEGIFKEGIGSIQGTS